MQLNLLDYLLVAVVAISVITAGSKGFAYEVMMMAATLAGLGLAVWKYLELAVHLRFLTANEDVRCFLAFIFIFAAVMILAAVVARIARKVLRIAGLGWLDRGLGAGLGLIRGLLIGSMLVVVLTAFPWNPRLVNNSYLAPSLLRGGRLMARVLPRDLELRFERGWRKVQRSQM